MEEAFEGADVVYPKSWAPISIMNRRTELLDAGDHAALASLEGEALAENAKHRSWHCDEELMAKTKGGKALYMHCLPADVSGVSCEHGEVSEAVFDRYRLNTYKEASYKPFVIAAMILLTRFEEPAEVLRACMERKTHRSL
jgi:ornithine carbamoyltransferase